MQSPLKSFPCKVDSACPADVSGLDPGPWSRLGSLRGSTSTLMASPSALPPPGLSATPQKIGAVLLGNQAAGGAAFHYKSGLAILHFQGARAACQCSAMRKPHCSIVLVPRSQLLSTVAPVSLGDACLEAALGILYIAWNSLFGT